MYEFKSTYMFQTKVITNDCQHIHHTRYKVSCLHLGQIFDSENGVLTLSL
jgi:hypothetical protein